MRKTVTQSVTMLPALVNPAHPGVQALTNAHQSIIGTPPRTYHGQGTYDAGGPCARGVPTVMYGAGGGVGLTGVDFVPIAMVEQEARVLTELIERELS